MGYCGVCFEVLSVPDMLLDKLKQFYLSLSRIISGCFSHQYSEEGPNASIPKVKGGDKYVYKVIYHVGRV